VRFADAAGGRVAGVGSADVAVVAVEGRAADADAAGAGVGRGAGVAVVAGTRGGRAAGADAGTVTRRGGQADVRARARRPRRVELAGGRAAVAIQRVAVVALLARLDHAVAADRGFLAEDGPEVRLDAAGRQPWPLDAEEVRAARAARDRMQNRGIPDVPGGRRRRGRVPLEPIADPGERGEGRGKGVEPRRGRR